MLPIPVAGICLAADVSGKMGERDLGPAYGDHLLPGFEGTVMLVILRNGVTLLVK
jgi:hypothetical protein